MRIACASWKIASDKDASFYRVLNTRLYTIFYNADQLDVEKIEQLSVLANLKIYHQIATDIHENVGVIILPQTQKINDPIDLDMLFENFSDSFISAEAYFDISQETEVLKFERALRHIFGLPAAGEAIYPYKVSAGFAAKIKVNHSVYAGKDKYYWNEVESKKNSTDQLSEANILLKVTRASICQSDRRVLKGAKDNVFGKKQIILGHEGGGYIVDPGPWQRTLHSGQKALVLPHLTCNKCEYCLSYKPNLCRKLQHLGFHIDGCLAEYTALPRQCLFTLPDDFLEDAMPLVEPLACVLRALFKIQKPLAKLNVTEKRRSFCHLWVWANRKFI